MRSKTRPRSSPTSSRSAGRILQDATPLTLGQEFSGYATQVRKGIGRVGGAAGAARTRAGRHRRRHRLNARAGFAEAFAAEAAKSPAWSS